MVKLMMMEVLLVEEKKVLNIKNLIYQKIMNAMDVLYNGNGVHPMEIYILVVIL